MREREAVRVWRRKKCWRVRLWVVAAPPKDRLIRPNLNAVESDIKHN